MLPTPFDPKFRNRFIVHFDGIDPFLLKKIDYSPLIPIKEVSTMKPKGEAKMHLWCAVSPNTEQQVFTIAEEQFTRTLDDCVVKYVDATGTVVNQHILKEPRITEVEFLEPSYDLNEPMVMVVTFRYEEFVLDF